MSDRLINTPTKAQKQELDKRLKRFNSGETKFYTLTELENKLKEAL